MLNASGTEAIRSEKAPCSRRSVSKTWTGNSTSPWPLWLAPAGRSVVCKNTTCRGFGTGKFLSTTAFITLKMAVFAPIPNASIRITTAENSGLRRKARSANFNSGSRFLIYSSTNEPRKRLIGMAAAFGGAVSRLAGNPPPFTECREL